MVLEFVEGSRRDDGFHFPVWGENGFYTFYTFYNVENECFIYSTTILQTFYKFLQKGEIVKTFYKLLHFLQDFYKCRSL